MSIKQAYLIEIERETENTRKLISVIKDEHLNFKPHPKSISLGQLAAHIVELHNWVGIALQTNEFNFHTSYQPFIPKNAQELIDVLMKSSS